MGSPFPGDDGSRRPATWFPAEADGRKGRENLKERRRGGGKVGDLKARVKSSSSKGLRDWLGVFSSLFCSS